jgi:ligand-binding sensor domain-containing protein
MYGGIECETKPEGAAIFLNDSATGKVTPHSFNNIWPDYYKVTYKLENHREDSVKVGIQSSKIVSAAKKLTDTTSWVIYMPEHYNIPSDQLNHIELDGNIKWIGTNDGGIAKFDGKKFQVFDKNNSVLPSNRIKALFVDKSKKLWIGTTKGLVKKSGDSWELFTTANSPLPSDIINALEEDNLGNIWVGTEKGAAVYESGNWRVYNSQHGQISIENVTSIAMDNQNRIWISTLSDGLFIYNGNEWSRLSVDNDEIFPGDAILEIDFAPDGTKWVGFLGNKDVQNGSLATDKTGEWSHYLHEKRIYDIYFHDNETWVCTNVFLMRFINEPGDGIIYNTDNSQISSNIIRDIEIDNNGFLWIATTRGGLVKYKEAY